jgi:hypothetical protein
MLAAAYSGSLGNAHFDGVMDLHIGKAMPLWFFFAEVVIDWLCLSVVLLIAAFIVSRSSFRIIDIFGTQALARIPYFFAILVVLPKGFSRFAEYLAAKAMNQPTTITIVNLDVLLFIVGTVVILLMLVWMVVLMYKAYVISCNVKGAKAVVTFILSLILAEIVSKVLILALLRNRL